MVCRFRDGLVEGEGEREYTGGQWKSRQFFPWCVSSKSSKG